MNDKFRYTKQSIDPSILSVLDIAADGKVISAQDWTELWSLVIKRINKIDTFNVEVNEFCVAWDDTINTLTAVVEDFNNKYNAFKNGYVYYGADEPTNPEILFWIQPVSETSPDNVDDGTVDQHYNPASPRAQSGKAVAEALENINVDIDTSLFASAIQNTASGSVISVNDVSALDHTVKVELSGEVVENLMPSSSYGDFFPYLDNGDGSLTINTNIPSDNFYPFIVYHSGGDALKPIEEGTYALDLGTATTQMYLEVQLNTSDYSNQKTYQTDSTGKVTFTVGAEDYMESLMLRPTNGTTIENLLIKPMLYKVEEALFDTPTPSTNQGAIDYHDSVAIRVKMELKDWTTYTVQFKCNYAGYGLHHHPLLTSGGDTSSKVTTGEVQTITFTTQALSGEYPPQYLYSDGYWEILCYDAFAPADIEFTNLAISEGTEITGGTDYSQVKLYRYGVNSNVAKLELTPNADGTVDVPSLAPYMSLVTDKCGLTITATYNIGTKDYIDKKFAEISNALLNL